MRPPRLPSGPSRPNFSLSMGVPGIDRISRSFSGIIGGPMSDFMKEAAQHAKREAERGAPGSTARSFKAEVKPMSARVYSTQSPAKMNTLESGRKPGAKMPPPNALAEWARRAGFTGSLVVLARAISRRGRKGLFFMRHAKQSTEKRLPSLKTKLGKDIVAEFKRKGRSG